MNIVLLQSSYSFTIITSFSPFFPHNLCRKNYQVSGKSMETRGRNAGHGALASQAIIAGVPGPFPFLVSCCRHVGWSRELRVFFFQNDCRGRRHLAKPSRQTMLSSKPFRTGSWRMPAVRALFRAHVIGVDQPTELSVGSVFDVFYAKTRFGNSLTRLARTTK